MRRCIVCRKSKPQDELIRFTLKDGSIRADGEIRSDGRGLYLCFDRECADAAIKRKAFSRACRRNVGTEEVTKAIREAFNGRQGGIDVKDS